MQYTPFKVVTKYQLILCVVQYILVAYLFYTYSFVPLGASQVVQWKRIHLPNRRHGFHPWVGRSSGEGNGNPLLYSCLGNTIDRGAWGPTVRGGHKRVSHDLVTKHTHTQLVPLIPYPYLALLLFHGSVQSLSRVRLFVIP